MTSQATLNRIWAKVLLEELTRLGVSKVCVAPGSRSTPLVLEAEANTKLQLFSHFDERGLGFLALGMAKASQEPVAVIVTSGTAVANLLPAVAESRLTGERLVLLTADRPVELIDCGANQAIRQTGIFSGHVTDSLVLPSPTEQIPLSWLLSSVDQKMAQQAQTGGSLHINCPFPEPIYGEIKPELYSTYLAPLERWREDERPYTCKVNHGSLLPQPYSGLSGKRGMLVIGSVSLNEALAAKRLGEKLGWPVLCDVQSGVSSGWQHYDIWLQHPKAQQALEACDFILQCGGRLVSKRLNAFIARQVAEGGAEYLQLSSRNERLNPDHLSLSQIQGDIISWVEQQLAQPELQTPRFAGWGNGLIGYAVQVRQYAMDTDLLTEMGLAAGIDRFCPTGSLFIGNSLIVRLLDMVAALDEKPVFTNRGASGIDGLVAAAVGVQLATDEPLTLLIGDTSLLYDLNSLVLLRQCTRPVTIIVTNNNGGAIFGMLPVPEEQKQALYQMPHDLTFEYAARQFGLAYLRPETPVQMQQAIEQQMTDPRENGTTGALLIELVTPADQATLAIKTLVARLNAAE